jgi:REP element-mobilizing transposase RayT
LGNCWLRLPQVATIVEQPFLAFDGDRYCLYAWTIMPNHVDVLLGILGESTLSDIVASWKKFTARRCNQQLGRFGQFWQPDYWDRFIRNDEHFEAAVGYIDNNSVKAGLARIPADWSWGSARFMR